MLLLIVSKNKMLRNKLEILCAINFDCDFCIIVITYNYYNNLCILLSILLSHETIFNHIS